MCVRVRVRVRVRVCVCACACVYVHMGACVYVCTCMCVCLCVCTCAYECSNLLILLLVLHCRAKDIRNKEFFEKHFPEIKRHTLRLGPKGFSVVRSEAELNEILDELYEQEEASHNPHSPLYEGN